MWIEKDAAGLIPALETEQYAHLVVYGGATRQGSPLNDVHLYNLRTGALVAR